MSYTVIANDARVCITCRTNKPLTEFGSYPYITKQGKESRRHSSRCRACEAERSRARPRKSSRKWTEWRHNKPQAKPGMKFCSICRQELPATEFYPSPNFKDGRYVECKTCRKDAAREHGKLRRPLTKEYVRKATIKRKYGLSPEDHAAMLAAQGGVCKTCGVAGKRNLCVDHDHATGKIRGLLCLNCNAALGNAKDSIATLKKMIEYLGG